jgi:hypothetical protein
MNFIDKYGRWHDKPVTKYEPLPSNNAYIYTATAFLLGIPLDHTSIKKCFLSSLNGYSFDRHPNDDLPPVSRDEIQGAIILNLIDPSHIIKNKFYYNNLGSPEKSSLWEKLQIMYEMSKLQGGARRNYVWDKPKIWSWSFTLHKQDQFFVLKMAGQNVSLFLTLFFYISSFLTLYKSNAGNLVILWQKLKAMGMEGSVLYKRDKFKKAIVDYYGITHPFSDEVSNV